MSIPRRLIVAPNQSAAAMKPDITDTHRRTILTERNFESFEVTRPHSPARIESRRFPFPQSYFRHRIYFFANSSEARNSILKFIVEAETANPSRQHL
jgi:hypothetical protein